VHNVIDKHHLVLQQLVPRHTINELNQQRPAAINTQRRKTATTAAANNNYKDCLHRNLINKMKCDTLIPNVDMDAFASSMDCCDLDL